MLPKKSNNMPQHTPGPWEACGESSVSVNESITVTPNHVRHVSFDGQGRRVTRFIADCNRLPEAAANARLIAAAPDLLSALKWAENMLHGVITEEMVGYLRGVIAKAEGQ